SDVEKSFLATEAVLRAKSVAASCPHPWSHPEFHFQVLPCSRSKPFWVSPLDSDSPGWWIPRGPSPVLLAAAQRCDQLLLESGPLVLADDPGSLRGQIFAVQ